MGSFCRDDEPRVAGERGELLVLEGDAGWQRGEVPMNVPVCLLTAEAEYVQALGWYDCADRLARLDG
jgi:hypothetical protein